MTNFLCKRRDHEQTATFVAVAENTKACAGNAVGVGTGSNTSEDGGLALGFKVISEGVDALALDTNAQALAEASQI